MSEVITNPTSSVEANSIASDKGRLRRVVEKTSAFLEVVEDIWNTRDAVKAAKAEMAVHTAPYGGLIERQAEPEHRLSDGLTDDITLDFRLAAQREGYTDLDTMQDELRTVTADRVVDARSADILAEIRAGSPDLSDEAIRIKADQKTSDLKQLLAMNTEQWDAYERSMLGYIDSRDQLDATQKDLEALRQERNERLGRFGRMAVKAARFVTTKAMIAGAHIVDRSKNDVEARGRLKGRMTALALGGIALFYAYMHTRHGMGGHSGGGVQYNLADYQQPATPPPTSIGGSPDTVSPPTSIGGNSTTTSPPTSIGGNTVPPPTHIGGGESVPAPTSIGGDSGSREIVGWVDGSKGGDMSHISTSSELFGDGPNTIDQWPDKITVSHWNSRTMDGSLSGISQQLLRRAGVAHPTHNQIYTLVDALRPQAQPNGHLLNGQQLDLTPATKLLHQMVGKTK